MVYAHHLSAPARRHRSARARIRQAPFLDALESRQYLSGSATLTITTGGVPWYATPGISTAYETIAENVTRPLASSAFTRVYGPASTSVLGISAAPLDHITILSLPVNGTLTFNGQPATVNETVGAQDLSSLSYTPQTNYLGADAFIWSATASDHSTSNSASFELTVGNTPPTVHDGSAQLAATGSTTVLNGDLGRSVSDPDPGDSVQSVQITALPTRGTLSYNGAPVTLNAVLSLADGQSLVYTPTADGLGNDTFSYRASDGLDFSSNDATFTLAVATAHDDLWNVTVGVPAAMSLSDFSDSFSDVDPAAQQTSTIMIGNQLFQTSRAVFQTIQITSLPTHGALTLNGSPLVADQTIAAANVSGLLYSPVHGYAGTDTFQWTASDGVNVTPTPGTVTFNVQRAIVGAGGNYMVNQGNSLTIGPSLFTVNRTYSSGLVVAGVSSITNPPPLTAQLMEFTSLPTAGVLSINGQPVTQTNQPLSLSSISSITYTPNPDQGGIQDHFSWTASPTNNPADFAATPATTTITLNVTAPASGDPGSGTPHPQAASPTNVADFGNWAIHPDASLQQLTHLYTITNSGSSPLDLSKLVITGKNAADFSIVSAPGSIAPGASATVTIAFTPLVTGKRVAVLTLPSLGKRKPLYTFKIQGTGLSTTTVPAITGQSSTGIVQVATTKQGRGTGAANGEIVVVRYTVHLADGTLADASSQHPASAAGFALRLDDDYVDNQPFLNNDQTNPYWNGTATVDVGVIGGWEYGLQGIKTGESRTLFINSDAGYGSGGNGTIPGNATLIFDIQCVRVVSRPSLGVDAPLAGGRRIVLVPGETTPGASDGTLLTVASGQSTATQTFELSPIGTIESDGTPVASFTLAKNPIKITGPNAKDFAWTLDNDTLTLTFTPHAAGSRHATVHVLTKDPVNPDFTFAIEGMS